jgi:hypothetical protein
MYAYTCDMMTMMGINEQDLMSLPTRNGNYNDPMDFITFLKIKSGPAPLNPDGYGLVAYRYGSSFISSGDMWYKNGSPAWYDSSNIDEPLDQAILQLMPENDVSILMGHVRNGTGGRGNHPFILQTDNATYSFIHNGYFNSSIKQSLLAYLGFDWFNQYPSQWEGLPYDASSFIDSELLFHYLMSYIVEYENDIPTALALAFNNNEVAGTDMEYNLKYSTAGKYNFILSNGEDIYIYRSTNIVGASYNLCYENINDQFWAVMTNTGLDNTVAKNQLLVLSNDGSASSIPTTVSDNVDFEFNRANFISASKAKVDWQVRSNEEIEYFLVYKSIDKDFSKSSVLGDTLYVDHDSDNRFYSRLDNDATAKQYYYWIKAFFLDGRCKLSPNLHAINVYLPDEDNEQEIDIAYIYPNPFSDVAQIAGYLPSDSRIEVFNIKGQLIKSFDYPATKKQNVFWDGKNNNGKAVADGVYFLKVSNSKSSVIKKIVKIKTK